MAHLYTRHTHLFKCHDSCNDSFVCVAWLIRVINVLPWCVQHDSFTCGTCHIYSHLYSDAHLYTCPNWFTCVTWLVHIIGVRSSCVQHDSFICVTCRIYIRVMTHSYQEHDSFSQMKCLVDIVTWRLHSHVTHECHYSLTRDSFIWAALVYTTHNIWVIYRQIYLCTHNIWSNIS